MDGVFETQPDRTDLPLVVMPVVIESMIGPFKQNFTMLENVARVRMYEDFTLDEDTIVERCKDADAVMVIGFHCADAILDRLDAKCYAFGGTGVASYINLEKTKERGIRVCNVLHYGDHAVAEHAMALLMELTRHAGALDMQVKQGDWDGADGFELFGKKLGIIGLGGIGQTVAGIANAFGMKVSAWNSHVPAQVFENPWHHHGEEPRRVASGNPVRQHRPRRSHRTRRTARKTSTRRHSGGLGRVRS